MLKKELEILEPFVEKPWLRLTYNQIKAYTKKKSKSYVHNLLKKYAKQGILKQESVGKSILYSLEPDNKEAGFYFGVVSEHIGLNQKQIPYKEIAAITKKMPTYFFIMLVTGSYARNRQTRESDLDIAIICDDSFEPKKIYAELKHACEMSIPKIHLYAFKKSEYIQMLLDDNANYGKETVNNRLVLYGGEAYFKIISEAIKHGFHG